MSNHVICPACQSAHAFTGTLSFRAECERCSADLHVCVACRHYDPYADNACREVQAEYVADKSRRNLCEDFKPAPARAGTTDPQADAKAKLAALFGDVTPPVAAPATSSAHPADAAAEARARLEALFRKA